MGGGSSGGRSVLRVVSDLTVHTAAGIDVSLASSCGQTALSLQVNSSVGGWIFIAIIIRSIFVSFLEILAIH